MENITQDLAIPLKPLITAEDVKQSYEALRRGLTSLTYDKFGNEIENTKEQRECAVAILNIAGHIKRQTDEIPKEVIIKMQPDDVKHLEQLAFEISEMNRKLGLQSWQRGELIEIESATVKG